MPKIALSTQQPMEREMKTVATAGVIVGIPLIVGVLPLLVIGALLHLIVG